MRVGFYRYISFQQEVKQVLIDRRVQSTNPLTRNATWYTTIRFDDPTTARRELALKNLPTSRIGPIPWNEMPDLDIAFRQAAPLNGQPGGAIEVCTSSPVWLFGIWNFQGSKWEI
jgi:hypothetical protein